MDIQKSLIYNSVSIFTLIENVEYIQFNFSGSSYKITRKAIEDNYPNYRVGLAINIKSKKLDLNKKSIFN